MTENAKLIESMYQAFSRGDIPFILDRLTDDCDWNGSESPEIPYHGSYRGREGAAQFFHRISSAFEPLEFVPEVYMCDGDQVMTTGWWRCAVRATGAQFRSVWAMRFVVKNGKVAYFRSYDDTAVPAAALRGVPAGATV